MKKISIRRMSILFAMAFIMALAIIPVNAMGLTMAPPAVTLDCCAAEEAARCGHPTVVIRETFRTFTCFCGLIWGYHIIIHSCWDCGYELWWTSTRPWCCP